MNKNISAIKHIHIVRDDITKIATDAIVNAANTSLLGGGGVDGAIHRAAGEELLKECKTLGGCNPGEARITNGYNLRASFVIHTPGPIYHVGNSGEEEILKNSYKNSMSLALQKGLKSIAFPAISTGVYGYPKEKACRIAVDSVINFMENSEYYPEVYFVLFDAENYEIYLKFINSFEKS